MKYCAFCGQKIHKTKKVTKRSYKFTFGKYKGKTLDWVIKYDPSYADWANRKVSWILLSKEDGAEVLRNLGKQRNHSRYLDCGGYLGSIFPHPWDTNGVSEADFMGW